MRRKLGDSCPKVQEPVTATIVAVGQSVSTMSRVPFFQCVSVCWFPLYQIQTLHILPGLSLALVCIAKNVEMQYNYHENIFLI